MTVSRVSHSNKQTLIGEQNEPLVGGGCHACPYVVYIYVYTYTYICVCVCNTLKRGSARRRIYELDLK